MADRVEFNLSISADIQYGFAGWTDAQIAAFLDGIALLLAASNEAKEVARAR